MSTYVIIGNHHARGSFHVRTKESLGSFLPNSGHHVFDGRRSKVGQILVTRIHDRRRHGLEDRVRVARKGHVQDFGPSVGEPTVAQHHGTLAVGDKLARHGFHAERTRAVGRSTRDSESECHCENK